MNIEEAKQQVKDTVEAYLQKDELGMPVIAPARQRPLFLLGAPGIGKTAIMEQVAFELGIGLVAYSMTHHTRQSALGLPAIVECEFDGQPYEASQYTMSEIIAAIYDYMRETGVREGILFLDEVNCVSETLYPSMLQFLQFKTFGRHSVPEGWVVVCAGNPPEYNRSVHEFDIVTLDRLRKIDVEPDFNAWKNYALNADTHPAILSYLNVRNDSFYSVESKPGGKSFVTARSWSDLSDVMNLFESMGKTVDQRLFQQFLQDDEIAMRFASYYDLFNKYKSDYQVDAILQGAAGHEVLARAQEAKFDERMALLGLITDAISQEAAGVLLEERAMVQVRDALREAKEAVLNGGSLTDALDQTVHAWDNKATQLAKSGVAAKAELRVLKRAADIAREIAQSCLRAGVLAGPEALEEATGAFAPFVSGLQADAAKVETHLSNAFNFFEDAFEGDREMLVFTAELTARNATAQFINRFGSDSYYAHNDGLMHDKHQQDLLNRIDQLDLDALKSKKCTSRMAHEKESGDTMIEETTLQQYYDGAQFEFGHASLCKMTLPNNLNGLSVLDVGCRRGKGVFKLSERVGAEGCVVGLDWTPAYIEEATRKMERAWHDNGLPANNMRFVVGYPERLDLAGIADASVDVVFVNSVANLFYNAEAAYCEIARVLKPGGRLIDETVLASGKRNEDVVAQARAIGNSVQSAPDKATFEAMLKKAGFSNVSYSNQAPIDPTSGAFVDRPVEAVAADEDVTFEALVTTAIK